jgi:hypothetical protein
MPERGVARQVFPVAEAYWTVQPESGVAMLPRLNSSMKSCLKGAPDLPPPPYTWLITTSEAVHAGGGPCRVCSQAKRASEAYA